MIYLDNAATSFPKPRQVVHEVVNCIEKYCGNPGRSSHKLSLAALDKIFEVREAISDFLDNDRCENVVFTPNATFALNLVIKGLITKKCHCIISDLEHNSVIRPLKKRLKEVGGELSVFDTDLPLCDAILPLIRDDTEIVICTLCSNVTGKFVNLSEISEIARKRNLKLVLDASQYVGHSPLKLSGVYYTALCTAGHKNLFGIQGSGFAIINDCKFFDTLIEGGSGVDTFSADMPKLLPERYEAGTLSTPAIASVGAGINYINEVSVEAIEKKLIYLTKLLEYELRSIPTVEIYGANNGIVSFNMSDYTSSYVSNILDKHGIATRGGFHCAPIIHQKLGTEDRGVVRVSLSYFNTEKEIYTLSKILRKI